MGRKQQIVKDNKRILSPTEKILINTQEIPHYLMTQPLAFSAVSPCNTYMVSLSDEDRLIDRERAHQQWMAIYNFLASDSVVYLAPVPNTPHLQDQVFASNLGVIIEHPDKDIYIVSNYSAKPRVDETAQTKAFMELMGYEVHVCPYKFEGDADLKPLKGHSGVYVGMYGIRSELKAFEWMEEKFGIKIIKMKAHNEDLYHLDVNFNPITKEDAICCVESFEPEDIAELEKYITLHPISTDLALFGTSSILRYYNMLLVGSFIEEYSSGDKIDEDYKLEVKKNRFLEDLASDLGLDLIMFNISEFYKGGADFSCLFCSLNNSSFNIDVL